MSNEQNATVENAARADNAALIAENWTLVPVKPTMEMLNAAIDVDSFKLGDISPLGFRVSPQMLFEKCYAAMIAAAPTPHSQQEGMMSDLVERLRAVDVSWSQVGEDCSAAADEIERLMEALERVSTSNNLPFIWEVSKTALNSSGNLTSSVVKDCLTTDCVTRRQIIDERDKTFLVMLSRAEAAELKAAALREALQWYVDNDNTNEGGDWEKVNSFWLDGRNRARAALEEK